jgi:biopolymer transport protein ExbD
MGLLKRKNKEAPEIDVGAFSDIAFLLIIFFILTTTFEQTMGRQVKIPSGGEGESSESDDKQISINLDGKRISYGEDARMVTIDQLREELLKQNFPGKKDDQQKMVVVEATATVSYNLFFKVVNAITDAGGILAIMEEKGKKK